VGIPENRVKVIYNGLDLDEFADLPPRGTFRSRFPDLDGKTKIILFLGRIHQIKGINYLIEAFSHLRKEQVDAFLVIAGPDDGELANLQVLTNHLLMQERVRFVGPLYGRDKQAVLVDADVLVSCGIYEIFGLVPFEALMCGTPVIVTDDSGVGNLVRESGSGYLVSYGDVPNLEATLINVLIKPEEAMKKVLRGQEYIHQSLDWQVLILQLVRTYRQAIQASSIPASPRRG
jgi:glycosyltransferase involved in cell wall biosynthesis